jgi:hypothetical protein
MHPTHNPPEVEQTPADVLRHAALYLSRHGWIQRTYYGTPGPTPPACALGAIAMAAYGNPVAEPFNVDQPGWSDYYNAAESFNDYLHLAGLMPDDPDSTGENGDDFDVYDWNDLAATTGEQVITALQSAAQQWETEHTGGAR